MLSEELPRLKEEFFSGSTMQEIAKKRGVSRQAVHLLLKRAGITWMDGGASVRANKKRLEELEKKRKKYQSRYGCSPKEYMLIPRSARVKFKNQKMSAGHRGISWKLNLSSWWRIWTDSGVWKIRGRKKGQMVMARFGDEGAYEVGNVYITTVSKNIKLYCEQKFNKNYGAMDGAIIPCQ